MAIPDDIRCSICGDRPKKPIPLADARVVCYDCLQEAVLADLEKQWQEEHHADH